MPKVFQVKVALIAALFMVMGMSAATAMDNRAQAALLTKHAQAEAGGQAAAKPAAVEAAPEPAEPEPEPEAEAQPELEETPAPAAEEPVEEVAVEGEEEEAAAPPPPPKDKTPRKVVFDKRAKEMAPAVFDHFGHTAKGGMETACTDCHHTDTGEKVAFGCSACHGKVSKGLQFSAKGAQHKSCIGCHLQANAGAEAEKAPVACEGCHVE